MKINELIKEVTQEYIPVKKAVVEAQKSGKGLSEAEEQKYFELNTTLELYKILKGAFMEEITKNNKVFPVMLAEKLITTRQEDAEKDGKTIKVTVVNESMDYQIDNLPEQFQRTVLERMVKAHKDNITIYSDPKNAEKMKDAYRKESFELSVLNQFLPKEATEEDVRNWMQENYPDGISMKEMGQTIGKAKAAFERADGKMVSTVVRSFVK
jgi:uncharacterized protein YqeY